MRLKIYTREKLEPHLQGKFAEILAILLQVFRRSTKLIKNGTLGRVLQFTKNVLLGRDEKLQGLVDQLEKLCQGQQRLVAAETLTEVKRTGHTVEGIDMTLGDTKTIVQDTNTRMNHVSSDMENLTVGQQKFHAEFRLEMENMTTFLGSRNRGIERIKEILQPSVYPQDMYQSIAKRRVPGTGDWVRSEQCPGMDGEEPRPSATDIWKPWKWEKFRRAEHHLADAGAASSVPESTISHFGWLLLFQGHEPRNQESPSRIEGPGVSNL